MKRLVIKIETGELAGRTFDIPKSGLRLGRSSSNDLAIRDAELSRNHCMFEQAGEAAIRLIDLSSANGTYVNGRRLRNDPVDLHDGDRIRVGETAIVVTVGEEGAASAGVDLGLGVGRTDTDAAVASDNTASGRMSSRRAMLWTLVALVVAGATAVFLLTPAEPPPKTVEVVQEPETLLEMSYERVIGDSESVYRFWMRYDASGMLSVQIDDLAGEGRHVSRNEHLGVNSIRGLMEVLMDEGLRAVKEDVRGPDVEPPRLDSWQIAFRTTTGEYALSVVNAPEPAAVRRVAERLEAFVMNELGIRAMQYTREQLVAMATAAADTGRMKWEDRDVVYGNLDASIRAYREALADLETLNPKPPEFDEYRKALERSEKELTERYRNQRFVAEQACSVGDWEKAKEELQVLCEMIPERDDERHREASAKLIDVENRLRKGGR